MANEYLAFDLKESAGVRPTLLRYRLPVDGKRLREYAREVGASQRAGKRVGKEWRPSDVSVVPKDAADDSWATNDELRPWNDACTKWCTERYFPNAFSRVNMVANVVRVFDALRRESGLPFHIVFKGGVMIRSVLMEFVQNLPLRNRTPLVEFLMTNNTLSMSDFDFEIVQEDKSPSSSKVHRLLALQYATLLWIQRQMEKELGDGGSSGKGDGLLYRDTGRSVEAEAQELKVRLQSIVSELPKEHALHGATVDDVSLSADPVPKRMPHRTKSGESSARPRQNVVIFDCDETRCILTALRFFAELGINDVHSRSGGKWFYSTLNHYIGETQDPPVREGHLGSVFHLARIKHAFVVYYTTRDGHKRIDRLGGEMIDLSQSHGTDTDLTRRRLYEKVKSPYREYALIGVDPRDVMLRSYSLEGFLWDHVLMLHHSEALPWEANKLEKRIVRYVVFLVASVMCHTGNLKALATACTHLRSATALASFRGRTGDRQVDAFLLREQRALASASGEHRRAATRYVRTLHDKLCAVVRHMPSQDTHWTTNAVTLPTLWFTDHVGKVQK